MPTARLASNAPMTESSRLLDFAAPLASHTRAGQYVTVTFAGGKPAYFALANAPGEPLSLLVKGEGEVARALVELAPGAELEHSEALGRGFALDAVVGRELVILCTGTGISACRPVIFGELAAGLPRPVHVYYGTRAAKDRCFAAELSAWEAAGVRVHTVVSGDDATWDGARGHVQQVARAHGLLRGEVAVLVAGVPGLIAEAKAMWTAAGVPPHAILTNF